MNDPTQKVREAVESIDITNVTPKEILEDMIEASRQFAFRAMVASALLDLVSKPQTDESQEQLQQVTQAN